MKRRRGYSLIELIIVVSILFILSTGVVFLAYSGVKRDFTFNAELNKAAERTAAHIYREIYGVEPGGIDDLLKSGLLVSSQ